MEDGRVLWTTTAVRKFLLISGSSPLVCSSHRFRLRRLIYRRSGDVNARRPTCSRSFSSGPSSPPNAKVLTSFHANALRPSALSHVANAVRECYANSLRLIPRRVGPSTTPLPVSGCALRGLPTLQPGEPPPAADRRRPPAHIQTPVRANRGRHALRRVPAVGPNRSSAGGSFVASFPLEEGDWSPTLLLLALSLESLQRWLWFNLLCWPATASPDPFFLYIIYCVLATYCPTKS